jgi:periplasmic copper chaperone A
MRFLMLFSLFLLTACSQGGIDISDAWARASIPGQSVGAAYMTITSQQDSALVYVETESAGSVQIHSMTMENGVMKMRMLEELALKAHQPEKLAPGGFHLMLFDLPKPLQAGEQIKFRMCFKDSAGKITEQYVTAPVKEAE